MVGIDRDDPASILRECSSLPRRRTFCFHIEPSRLSSKAAKLCKLATARVRIASAASSYSFLALAIISRSVMWEASHDDSRSCAVDIHCCIDGISRHISLNSGNVGGQWFPPLMHLRKPSAIAAGVRSRKPVNQVPSSDSPNPLVQRCP